MDSSLNQQARIDAAGDVLCPDLPAANLCLCEWKKGRQETEVRVIILNGSLSGQTVCTRDREGEKDDAKGIPVNPLTSTCKSNIKPLLSTGDRHKQLRSHCEHHFPTLSLCILFPLLFLLTMNLLFAPSSSLINASGSYLALRSWTDEVPTHAVKKTNDIKSGTPSHTIQYRRPVARVEDWFGTHLDASC